MRDEAITPLPLLKLLVASSMVFCNTFMMTVLMPFLTFLIDDMKIAPLPEDIGRYSGYMVSSFMIGQLLFSYSWGYLSDKFGRRPVMLIGLFLTGISFLFFGFTKDYYVALLIRFLCGSFNGIIGATKTYLSEITDETNQAAAFSAFGIARGLGMILGPIVGGFLCLPAQKYPSYFPKGSLFDMYPYALPCFFGSLIALFGTVVGFFVLEETNEEVLKIRNMRTQADDLETQPLLGQQGARGDDQIQNVDDGALSDTETLPTPLISSQAPNPKTMLEMFGMKKVAVSLFLYTSISFVYIQFDELFALWARLPFDEGGLEFDSSTMGKAYAIGGLSLLFYQMFIFSAVERYLGTLRTFQSGLIISLPSFLLLPCASLFRGNDVIVWFLIGLSMVLRSCGGVQSFTAVFLMVNNSITAESRGSLNGIGQTLGSLGRMCGPIFAGILFSWSLENHLPFPFDYHFVFSLLSSIILMILFASFLVPKDIDQRVVQEEENVVT